MLIEFFHQTIEYQRWGFNMLTVSSLATIFFTTVLGWAFWKQDQTVRERHSGKSVSALWHTYYAFLSLSTLIYGFHVTSIALIYNGLLCIPRFSIILGLRRYKGFALTEKISLAGFAVLPIAMYILPWKDPVFLVIAFGSIIAYAFQPWEIWKNKSAGDVDIRLIITYFIATLFWVIYSYIANIWSLMIINRIMLVLVGLTIVLWFRYRQRTAPKLP